MLLSSPETSSQSYSSSIMMAHIFLTLAVILSVSFSIHAGETCTETTGGDCTCSCVCEPFCFADFAECTSGFGASNEVVGFDGSVSSMNYDSKYLIASYKPFDDEVCKFRVRIDTDDKSGPVKVDWVGFAFGIHEKNSAKFEVNFRMSKTQGKIEVRGRGYKPPQIVTFAGGKECFDTSGGWYFCVEEVSAGVYQATAGRDDDSCWVTVDYFEDAATNDKVVVTVSDYYMGQLEGKCGNWDGMDSNDDQFCGNADPGGPQPCIDGEHLNN